MRIVESCISSCQLVGRQATTVSHAMHVSPGLPVPVAVALDRAARLGMFSE
jgi:hypothetical protein